MKEVIFEIWDQFKTAPVATTILVMKIFAIMGLSIGIIVLAIILGQNQ